MSNPGQFVNYQYLMYNTPQTNVAYPSLATTQQEEQPPVEINNKEELNNIVQYIKNLKDPEKR